MDSTPAIRQRVYIHARPIFSGNNAQLRRRKKVVELVQAYKVTLDPLLEELGESRLVDILRKLLEDRVFESDLRAKAEFPGLFSPILARDAEHEASEIDAARSTEDALEAMFSDVEEVPEDDDDIPPAPPLEEVVNVEKNARGSQEQSRLPSLYPSYLPYKTQHLLLTTAQQTLEECCFDFAKRYLPEVLAGQGWDDPTAIELTKWVKVIGKSEGVLPVDALDLGGTTLKQVFIKTHKIRHTAVHRVPTTARGVSQLLQHAVKLAEALRDHNRASRLDFLRSELDSMIKAMELNKNVLENDTSSQLAELRRQREELERQERELIANAIKEDLNNKALIGNLLEKSVGHIFSQEKGTSELPDDKEIDEETGTDESDGEGLVESGEVDAANEVEAGSKADWDRYLNQSS